MLYFSADSKIFLKDPGPLNSKNVFGVNESMRVRHLKHTCNALFLLIWHDSGCRCIGQYYSLSHTNDPQEVTRAAGRAAGRGRDAVSETGRRRYKGQSKQPAARVRGAGNEGGRVA
jgi:hypothetical protein